MLFSKTSLFSERRFFVLGLFLTLKINIGHCFLSPFSAEENKFLKKKNANWEDEYFPIAWG